MTNAFVEGIGLTPGNFKKNVSSLVSPKLA